MGDMDWIQDVPDNLNGIKFTHIDEPSNVYTIRDTEISPRRNEYHSYITVLNMRDQVIQQSVRRKNAYSNFKNGRWIIYDEKINESDDMDWIDDVSGDLQIGDSIIDHNDKKWRIIEIEPALHNPLVKVKRYGLKGVYDIFTKKNIVDKVSKGLWKLIPNPNINESNDMQWIEDVSPSDLYVGVRFRLESPHPNLGRRTRGPIFTVTEVLGDEFTSIDTEGYVWVVNIDAWQEWKNENNLYILEPNKDLMLKGSYKMGDDIG